MAPSPETRPRRCSALDPDTWNVMGSDPPVWISTSPEVKYQSNTSATPSLRSATKPSSDMDMIATSLDIAMFLSPPAYTETRDRSSAELLGERDEDALRATDLTESIAVFVLHQLPDQFGTVGAEPGHDVLDVFDGKHDATDAQRVRRGVVRLSAVRRGTPELHQLNTAMAVRGAHHGDVASNAVERDQ